MNASSVRANPNLNEVYVRWNIKGNPNRGLAMATLAFFGGFAGVSLFGPLAPKFSELLQLNPILAGLLVAIPSLGGALLRIPFGAMVDRYGGKRPMLVLLALPLIGLAGLIVVTSLYYPSKLTPQFFPILLVLGVVIGAGIATFSVGVGQVSYWFPRAKQGAALGIFGGLANTAPGLFAFLLPLAVAAIGLTSAYIAWLVFLAIVLVVYAVFAVDAPWFQLRCEMDSTSSTEAAKECGQELIPSGSSWGALRKAASDVRTWALVALYFTSFGGFLALTGWFPTYWHFYHGLGLPEAGLLTLIYSELASLTRAGTGFVTDRLGGEKVLFVGLAAMSFGALGIATGGAMEMALVGMVLMGVSMGAMNAAVFKLVPKYASRSIGGAAGWIGGIAAFGGFMIPPIMGAVAAAMGHAGYAAGFTLFVGLAVASAVIAVALQKANAPAAELQPKLGT